MQIYISRDGQQYGPFSAEEAQAHLATGSLLPTDYAFVEGMASWVTLDQVLQTVTQPVLPSGPLEGQPGQVAQHTNVEQASSRMAALMAEREAKKKGKAVGEEALALESTDDLPQTAVAIERLRFIAVYSRSCVPLMIVVIISNHVVI